MESLPRHPQTLSTSYLEARQTPIVASSDDSAWVVLENVLPSSGSYQHQQSALDVNQDASIHTYELGSTGKGVLIGMLSAFGSAALVALVLAIVYFFRYTNRGKIFLDRIGRPGEYDDEQAFLQEEERALEEMDDRQRAEYTRAKGGYNCDILYINMSCFILSIATGPLHLTFTNAGIQLSFKQTLLSRSRLIYHCLNS